MKTGMNSGTNSGTNSGMNSGTNTGMNTGGEEPAGIAGAAADEALAREAGRLLRASAGQLDGATASRLNLARQAALAHLDRAPRNETHGNEARMDRAPRAWWLPAGAATAMAVALLVVVALKPGGIGPGVGDPSPAPLAGLTDPAELELVLANGDNLEMMADLDFYLWLDEALEDTGSAEGEASRASPATVPGST